MTDFDALLAAYTEKGHAKVHGVICRCVNQHGDVIYDKLEGYNSVAPDAPPLRSDAVLKLGSATKLITSIALLQCIEKGLIGLDEPLATILPELAAKEILIDVKGTHFTSEPSTSAITARHLLAHTSGLGYPFTHKVLMLRAQVRAQQQIPRSLRVVERYNTPLVFEPGTGWLYGCSLDWAGIVVSRLNGGISLGDYFIEHIWKQLGLSAPFPTFNIAKHEDYNARLMQGAILTDGKLEPCDAWAFDDNEDEEGGSGLAATADDFVAVLADLVSETPKLLGLATIEQMFVPQLAPHSPSTKMLLDLRPAWNIVAGPIVDEGVNHGLGGILCVGSVPEIGQPENMLAWGGATNIVWWLNRERGVAGFFATQQAPFGNSEVTRLVDAWKKDFWTSLGSA